MLVNYEAIGGPLGEVLRNSPFDGVVCAFRTTANGHEHFITTGYELSGGEGGACGLLAIMLDDLISSYQSSVEEVKAMPDISVTSFLEKRDTDPFEVEMTSGLIVDVLERLESSFVGQKIREVSDITVMAFMRGLEAILRQRDPDLLLDLRRRQRAAKKL